MKAFRIIALLILGTATMAMGAVAVVPLLSQEVTELASADTTSVEPPPTEETPAAPPLTERFSLSSLADLAPSFAGGQAIEYTEILRPDLNPVRPLNMDYEPMVFGANSYIFLSGDIMHEYDVFVGQSVRGGTEPRPVVMLFHGSGRPALSMIDMWEHTANAEGLILVSVQSQSDEGWTTNPNGRLMRAILDQAAEQYPIDMERVYLFGHSAGAKFVQHLVHRSPGPWRAAAVHAGNLLPSDYSRAVAPIPVRHYLGDQDETFPLGPAQLAGQAAAAAGHPFELVIIPGHTHWYYNGGLLFSADAWAWFNEIAP